MSSRASARDLSAGYVKINENELQKAGLRGKKLIAVVTCLVTLWILAVITLICNILLLLVLRMNHRGMESIQFMRMDEEGHPNEHLVQFTGDQTDLGTIMINSGVMAGFKNQDFKLVAGKVILESKDTAPPTRMIVDGERIRIENVKDFLVTSRRSEGEGNIAVGERPSLTAQTLFGTLDPVFKISKSIRRLAGAKIGTNRIRSPVNSNLSLSSDGSLEFLGPNGNTFQAKSVKIHAANSVIMRADQSSIKLIGHGRSGVSLPRILKMPLSESPSFRADKVGLRLCACRNTGKLFGVAGNMKCRIEEAYCY